MSEWNLSADLPAEARNILGSIDSVFALQGDRVSQGPQSEVIRIEIAGIRYYVKRSRGSEKGLRRYIGQPRIRTEWENLMRFMEWKIPTTPPAAWGMAADGDRSRGALVTRELPSSMDLGTLARTGDPRLKNSGWLANISEQLAKITRILHHHRFAHNDLHWRNLLVDDQARLYLFDCPSGRFWWGPFLEYRIVKDLACLDRVAKRQVSRTRRLRFYLQYAGRRHLTTADKRRIRRVITFFKGRRQWDR